MPKDLGSVLVTGSAGYIGSVLAEKLLNAGYSVRVIDCMFFGDRGIKHLLGNEKLEVIDARIEDPEAVKKAVKGIDAVVHLAGLANDATCDINPVATKRINYDATKLLLKYSKSAKVRRFIYGSSASVYGSGTKLNLKENEKLKPVSLYAKYRVLCEKAVFASNSRQFDACCLRKSTVFGYSPRQRLDLVVNAMTANAYNKHELTLIGGTQWRPNLHVQDAAECYIRCIEADSDAIRKEIFNVGSAGSNLTIGQVAELVAKAVPGTKTVQKPLTDNISYNLNFDKLNSVLGFSCKHSIGFGISEIIKAFENNRIPNYEDAVYYNLRQMLKLKEAGEFG